MDGATSTTPPAKPDVHVVASTPSYDESSITSHARNTGRRSPPDFFYKSAQWTADGTTVITSSSDDRISAFVLPEDLLEPRAHPHVLAPKHTLSLPEPTHVVASAPYFSLSHPYTQTILVACRDHPIQLYHILPDQPASLSPSQASSPSSAPCYEHPPSHPPLSSFNLINPQTEAYQTPTALIWPSPGTHFIAGTTNLLAHFDITRLGSGPILRVPTIPSKRHISKGHGVGMRGTVSALAATPEGLVAAGTWTRWVGLYDFAGSGACVATWGVAGATKTPPGASDSPSLGDRDSSSSSNSIGGQGILQTAWSPCGRYLVVNERQSTGLLVYDVRVTGRLLAWLVGRDALTHQRLTCDVYPGSSASGEGGFEVWAGTRTGSVQVWDRAGMEEGCVRPAWGWQAHEDGSPVGSAAMHASGSVVATCSGGWSIPDEDDEEDGETDSSEDEGGSSGESSSSSLSSREPRRATRASPDNTLKIWSIGLGSGAPIPQGDMDD
ncbi:WD40-repeat-containing domain protein [Pleurostoma richardsiae]|uniref:WD40-repeat-containing domain protein n=1 Tax=Pleurostoma richardsiae TaxID=41990 RepID=A0AA38VFL2_9PEZI|nr:WD40-repeat-containing domain protein [Pleurostoma richardsiae]